MQTTAGRVFTGLLVSRTDKQVVIRDTKNQQTVIPAEEIEELVAQRKSLMPELLLKDMTADLEGMWQNEKDFTNVVKGYGVEDAFPEFIARKGRP